MKTVTCSLRLAGGIAALLFVSAVTGFGITNSVPYSWSFEGMTNGQDIIDTATDSWYGDAGALVATNGTYPEPGTGYPLATNHTTFAHLSAPVTNAIQGAINTIVWIDHMVKPEMWKQDDPPSDLPSDTQMAYFVNTGGHVVVYSTLADTNGVSVTNIWSELGDTTIASGAWARVSIGINYDKSTQDGRFRYYQVKVDGILQTSTNAITDPSAPDFSPGGSYFRLASSSGDKLNSIVMKGNGDFDDFVVSTNEPIFTFKYVIVASVMSGANGGNINPEGSIDVSAGSNQTFVVTASNYWNIEKVIIVENGVVSTNTPTASPYTNTFMNVAANGSIDVYFAAAATNGVPLWWMDDAGVIGTSPTNDPDGDGFTTADEYLSSTDPNNPNSFLHITRTWQANGTNYVQWESAYIDSSLPPFNVMSSTNLTGGAFIPAGTKVRGMTNVWSQPVAAPGLFYRVVAPAAP
jgi:hypothetical protein